MGRAGSEEQLARVPDWHRARYASMTKYIEVLGAESHAGGESGFDRAQRFAAREASTDCGGAQ